MLVEKQLRVCFPFTGDSVGGSHLSALTLIESLNPKEFKICIALGEEGPLSKILTEKKLPYVLLPPDLKLRAEKSLLLQLLNTVKAAPRLAHFLRSNKISIVHTNDLRNHLAWSVAALLAGTKHLWHQRTVNDSRRNGLFAWHSSVLTISNYCLKCLPETMRKKAEVVYNPVASELTSVSKAQAKEKIIKDLSLPSNARIIGYVGNFEGHKRAKTFIQCAEILKGSMPDLHFVMIGRGAQNVQTFVSQSNIKKEIHLLDFQHPIEPWIAGFDVLVAPGIKEGFGRTVVEAMLLQTPVVASRDGGHCEIVEDGLTGYLAEVDDAKDFALKIKKILQSDSLETMLVRAYSKARTEYSIEKHVNQISLLYRQLSGGLS